MKSRRPGRALVMAGAIISVALAGVFLRGRFSDASAGARPYVPAADDFVVERLGRSSRDPMTHEIATLRQALDDSPGDPALAARLARLEIKESRRRSDPRHLGYAQAALQPWWHVPAPPVEVLILRATIRQSRHEFEAARSDLDQAVARAPDDAQAWLTRSVVLAVLGHYDDARASCAPLPHLTSALVAEVCVAALDGVTGHAGPAAERLERALARVSHADDEAWALSVLADLDAVRGDVTAAERHLRAALALDGDDAYSRAILADLLLDAHRYSDAIEIVEGRDQNDGLLLRLVIAEHATRAPRATEHAAELAARFQASRARGDALHGREEARFELIIRNEPGRALELAQANWAVQHESADARILLETALASRRGGQAQPVLQWLSETHNEDRRLASLAEQVRERR